MSTISVLNTSASMSGKTISITERDESIAGLKTFSRAPSAPFAVQAGSAVVANLDADKLDGVELATLAQLAASNAFSHATAPITLSGASAVLDFSGITAPELRFSGTNGLIKSVGDLTLHIDSDANGSNSLKILGNASTQLFNLTDAGLMSLSVSGVFTDAKMTAGLIINQGANDDELFALKSSDVAHGITDVAETDTFAAFSKITATEGGCLLEAFTENLVAMRIRGNAVVPQTTKSTGGNAPVELTGYLKSGTSRGSLGANANILCVQDAGTTRFILDADGDSHQDVGTAWTNFDDDDDIKRMDAVAVALARENDPLRHEFVRDFERRRAIIEAIPGKALIAFNADGHHFVNMSRLAMLHHGAIRQLAREVVTLRQRLLEA